MNLEQSSVILTGAAGGIGSRTARALLAAGARLLVVDRSADALGQLMMDLDAQRLGRHRIDLLVTDLTRPEGREAVRQVAENRAANVLINNAGLPCFDKLGATGEAKIEQVLLVNLHVPILLTRLLLPHLQRQKEAAVLNLGSSLGRIGLPGYSVYAATKFGLHGFSESLRRELADGPVRVQYLGPRATRTAFNDARADAANRRSGTQTDSPETVGAAVVELLHSGAAERYLGFPEKLAVRLNGLMPGWFDRLFRKHREALEFTAPATTR